MKTRTDLVPVLKWSYLCACVLETLCEAEGFKLAAESSRRLQAEIRKVCPQVEGML